ncbi:MAG: hypothetical protein EOO38_22575 [Cytophagaceae bacterium]|nr:MAG: hypothetical protein EOO38_22575 [Cytophagaceae bacterium]
MLVPYAIVEADGLFIVHSHEKAMLSFESKEAAFLTVARALDLECHQYYERLAKLLISAA